MWTGNNFYNKAIFLSCIIVMGIVLSYLRYVQHLDLRSAGLVGRPIPSCDPKNNAMFLKTHKTGSTTLQSIFYRRASKHNLTVGLPTSGILFNYGAKFRRNFMKPLPPGRELNMLINHMVFDHAEVSNALPNDTFFVTILRDPSTKFESVFHYLRREVGAFRRIRTKTPFEDFVKDPKRYFKGPKDGSFWWFGKNNMFFDLGFDCLREDDLYIHDAIAKTEKKFNFVAIAEYFDISLLLIKDLLCWDMADVLYLSMNARSKSTVKTVNKEAVKQIYEWNKADALLYQHFNTTFWQRVETYGAARIAKELEQLQLAKENLQRSCVEDNMVNNIGIKNPKLKMFNPAGLEIMQYQLKEEAKKNESCIELILPELGWYRKFDCRQHSKC